jgi:hypothetical protein
MTGPAAKTDARHKNKGRPRIEEPRVSLSTRISIRTWTVLQASRENGESVGAVIDRMVAERLAQP